MADCFQGFENQESIMENVIYEYIYIIATAQSSGILKEKQKLGGTK